ncbi:hypothetical protein AAG596_04005 [Citromicrobium bathyomarinum]|uniref:hypothetical protein n=1 Tax=Citromicrobium TaxID=72173 RepID=UPI000225DEA9|nr:hypothetical protein [Citromicrobium sp. JLT1363]|tara:strand:+ start:131 stop:352 length:222 start_codon:yes stop_codon:yes gene_type:complete
MLNILSWLFGLVGLVIVILGLVPFIGILNWIALPFLVIGTILGFLSSSTSGRTFCIIVMIISIIRLVLGGGLL